MLGRHSPLLGKGYTILLLLDYVILAILLSIYILLVISLQDDKVGHDDVL